MKTNDCMVSGTSNPKPTTRNSQQSTLAWLCGGVYLLAAGPKLADPEAFYRGILAYKLLPDLPSWLLAHTLPWLELGVGLALLAPSISWRRAGAGWVAVLSVVFLLALGSVWARGMDIACGCFGAGGGWWNSVPVAMGKNAVLLLAANRMLTTKSH